MYAIGSVSLGASQHISSIIKRIAKSAFDQGSAELRRRDHERLFETALCGSPELLHALRQIRCLLLHCPEVPEP